MNTPTIDHHAAASRQQIAEERDAILRHKWLQSEQAHEDIGFEKALMHWMIYHHSQWLENRQRAQKDGLQKAPVNVESGSEQRQEGG